MAIVYLVQQGSYDTRHIVFVTGDMREAIAEANATHAKDTWEDVAVYEWTLDTPRVYKVNPLLVHEIDGKADDDVAVLANEEDSYWTE